MKCPKCSAEMREPSGTYSHDCPECGCIVCQYCGEAYNSPEEGERRDTINAGGADIYCWECGELIYDADY